VAAEAAVDDDPAADEVDAAADLAVARDAPTDDEAVVGVEVEAAAALSKYLSNAALAFPGGPNGVFFSFSPPLRSLLAERAR